MAGYSADKKKKKKEAALVVEKFSFSADRRVH